MYTIMKCFSCDQAVEEDWVACPRCGLALVQKCSTCGMRLEADWKHCPSCGCAADEDVHKTTVASGHVSKDVLRSIISTARCIIIFQESQVAYFDPFQDAFARLHDTEKPSQIIAAVNFDKWKEFVKQARAKAIESIISQSEFAGLDTAPLIQPQDEIALLGLLDEVRRAQLAAIEQDIADGALEVIWKGIKSSAIGDSSGGFLSLIPGVGHAVAGFNVAKRDNEVLERFTTAIGAFESEFIAAADRIHLGMMEWLQSEGWSFEVDTAGLLKRLERFREVEERLHEMDIEGFDRDGYLAEVMNSIEELPGLSEPHFTAAVVLVELKRYPEALEYALHACDLDPSNSLHHHILLIALAHGDQWDQFAHVAPQVHEKWPEDTEVAEAIALLLRDTPDPLRFEDLMTSILPVLKEAGDMSHEYLLSARIAASSGRLDIGADFLLKYLQCTQCDTEDLLRIHKDQVLADVLLSDSMLGIFSNTPDWANVVEFFLKDSDLIDLFWYEIPEAKRAKATESFVKLNEGESILCYYDSTFFGGGKEGFAFTTERVLWRALGENPVALPYVEIEGVELQFLENGDIEGLLIGRVAFDGHATEELEFPVPANQDAAARTFRVLAIAAIPD